MVDTPNTERRQALRTCIIRQRKALPATALQSAGAALLRNAQPFLSGARSVAGYNAINGEIPVGPLFEYCHHHDIATYVPIMRENSLVFAPFKPDTAFTAKQFGILEPDVPESTWVMPMQLDVVLVPLVAFDAQCNRMGMGGGFYDRSFAARKHTAPPPTMIGVAHALQQVESVFPEWWDVPLDMIITELSLLNVAGDAD